MTRDEKREAIARFFDKIKRDSDDYFQKWQAAFAKEPPHDP